MDAAPAWDRQASLRVRLLRAQADVSVLTLDATIQAETKSGKTYSYKGISHAQVVAKASAALIKHGVLYTPEQAQDKVEVSGNKTKVWVNGRFENVDDPADCIVRGAWGEGVDNAANGTAKAFTNANKQILAKTLNMSTVEDDKDTEVEHRPEGASPRQRESEAMTETAIRTWATAFKAAIEGCSTKAGLKKLRAENTSMLNSEHLPDATRNYFLDMLIALEETLA